MNAMVYLALFGWPLAALLLFALLPPRRATTVCLLAGWLFLPNAGFNLPGLPAYTKTTATMLPILIGAAVFDSGRLLALRPRWFDLPMLLWCLCPIATSLSNGLGIYDGLSEMLNQTVTWLVPYLLGRMYYSDWEGLRELAIGLFAGGLIYVPLCLWEIRMSPHLHRTVYGEHVGSFLQAERYGGYRPIVFLRHGLATAMWMVTAGVVGAWLWRTRASRGICGVPMWLLVPAVLVTAVLCKSTAAWAWLVLGLAVLFVGQWTQSRWAMIALVAVAPIYIAVRLSGLVPPDRVLWLVEGRLHPDRVMSLRSRLEQEELFSAKAMQRPAFGWSAWYFFPTDERGQKLTRGVDSLWIIALGAHGLVGLGALFGALLLPGLLFAVLIPPRLRNIPAAGSATALAVVSVLFVIDGLLNGLYNPVYVVAGGGLSLFSVGTERRLGRFFGWWSGAGRLQRRPAPPAGLRIGPPMIRLDSQPQRRNRAASGAGERPGGFR